MILDLHPDNREEIEGWVDEEGRKNVKSKPRFIVDRENRERAEAKAKAKTRRRGRSPKVEVKAECDADVESHGEGSED